MKIISVIFLTLFIVGCSSTQSEKVSPKETQKPQVETTQQYTPAPPKNSFKPKVVQVDNYTSEYMYPSKKMQPTPVNQVDQEEQNTATETMTKEECIAMIGEEKFEKYTQMFSSEAAAIKRCMLLKAMSNH